MSFIGLDALIMLINRFPKIVHLLAYVFVDGQNLNLDRSGKDFRRITLNMERVKNTTLNFVLPKNRPGKRN